MNVLIVDDEPAIAEALAYTLTQEGFSVECCELGNHALTRCAAGGVDFVVLDVGLPDMTGFDVCRELRRRADVPILFLTARADEVDRIVGLELGGDDYVTKPFSPREVASRIRAISRRARTEPKTYGSVQARPAPLENTPEKATGFVVDTDGQRIAYRDQWLNLTRYEYLLLALLLERPGRILSRAQIMDTVWQDGGESLERTVDTHIKTLRSKLRRVHDGEVIVTHRGLGYSLSLPLSRPFA